jgi:lipopolysaccharide export system protein LptC
MNAVQQALWACVALVLIACSGWYFASSSVTLKLDTDRLSTLPDAIITHLSVQQFDDQGQLSHSLITPVMHHIPYKNTHFITSPHIIVRQNNQPAWVIDSEKAIAEEGGQHITFQTHVLIHQPQDNTTQESTLKTEELNYFPKDQLATTLKEVTFAQAGNEVHSTGMTVYLSEHRVQLLSHARGTYSASTHG